MLLMGIILCWAEKAIKFCFCYHPLTWECIEYSGTSILLLHHSYYHPFLEHACRSLKDSHCFLHHSCYTPVMRTPGSFFDLYIIFVSFPLPPLPGRYPQASGIACHCCVTPVTTPARRMPGSLGDLRIIFASFLLPPLSEDCPEISGITYYC